MLEKIDLNKSLSKEQYKAFMPKLRGRLYQLQKQTWEAKIPVIIVMESWDLAGKGDIIQHLTRRLDPRGFKLHRIRPERTYEKKRPWLWRFWRQIPARGQWAIFDRSWYGRVMVERLEGLVDMKDWSRAYRNIADFEETLADDGYLIVKFFMHIDKKEQAKRIKKYSKDPLNAWRVKPEDKKRLKNYEDWILAYETTFEHTDTEWGPWFIIESNDHRYARIKIFRNLIKVLEDRLEVAT